MAADGGRIDFMFLGPPPYPAAGSATVNKQINLELYSSYFYLGLAYHFERDDIALAGFHKYFKKLSDEERCDAEKVDIDIHHVECKLLCRYLTSNFLSRISTQRMGWLNVHLSITNPCMPLHMGFFHFSAKNFDI